MHSPTTDQVKTARTEAGLTQAQCASLLHTDIRTWQRWEKGDRTMHPAFFELFTLKTSTTKAN